MAQDPLDRSEIRAALRPIFDLPTRDQLVALQILSEFLGDELGDETEIARQARERLAALEVMAAVAKQLRLGKGEAPTSTQFKDGVNSVDPDWNLARIVRAFGSYRVARRTYLGATVTQTPAQRALRRRIMRHRRTSADYLGGIRSWLSEKPARQEQAFYDDWVEKTNHERPDQPPLVKAKTTRNALGISWKELLAVARGETTLEKAQDARASATTSRFVGLREISHILGVRRAHVQRLYDAGKLPEPVTKLGRHVAWERADIDAYGAGREQAKGSSPAAPPLLTKGEVAKKLGLAVNSVQVLIGREAWDRVPPPAGKVSNSLYWYRDEVERWLRESRTEPKGP